MPGSVLSSLTARGLSSTKKSTRASPAQPTRRNVSTRQPPHRLDRRLAGSAAGSASSTPPSEYLAS